MKIIIILVLAFSTVKAFADSDCKLLESHLGEYHMDVSNSDKCAIKNKYLFGDKLVLSTELDGESTIYWSKTGNVGIGACTGDNCVDQCDKLREGVLIKTCSNSSSCIPQHWTYYFSQKSVSFNNNGCNAVYRK